jgi:hypothetical protein
MNIIFTISAFVWGLLAVISGIDGNAVGLVASLHSFFITLIYADSVKGDKK